MEKFFLTFRIVTIPITTISIHFIIPHTCISIKGNIYMFLMVNFHSLLFMAVVINHREIHLSSWL